jgi:hypothetical protein
MHVMNQDVAFDDVEEDEAGEDRVAISLAVFGFNLFGDSLRDVLDPRLRPQ